MDVTTTSSANGVVIGWTLVTNCKMSVDYYFEVVVSRINADNDTFTVIKRTRDNRIELFNLTSEYEYKAEISTVLRSCTTKIITVNFALTRE